MTPTVERVPSATEIDARIFHVEREGDTLVVVPLVDLRGLEVQRIERGAMDIFDHMKNGIIKNAVLDFHRTSYFCSSALAFFLRLWNRIRTGQGRMAFCNISATENEILRTTRLDQLWTVCASRPDALRAVRC